MLLVKKFFLSFIYMFIIYPITKFTHLGFLNCDMTGYFEWKITVGGELLQPIWKRNIAIAAFSLYISIYKSFFCIFHMQWPFLSTTLISSSLSHVFVCVCVSPCLDMLISWDVKMVLLQSTRAPTFCEFYFLKLWIFFSTT